MSIVPYGLETHHWTRFSKSGVNGESTLADPEKGRAIVEAVVTNLLRFVREFQDQPRRERTDYNQTTATGKFLPEVCPY